jgi:hypothetical protein
VEFSGQWSVFLVFRSGSSVDARRSGCQNHGLKPAFLLNLYGTAKGRALPVVLSPHKFLTVLVACVAERGDAVLDVEDQGLGAGGPVALGVVADDFLGEG